MNHVLLIILISDLDNKIKILFRYNQIVLRDAQLKDTCCNKENSNLIRGVFFTVNMVKNEQFSQ